MKKIHLEILLRIIGIGSASGLLYKDDTLQIISDNAGYLYEYNITSQELSKTPLYESDLMENIPKSQKLDFESITRHADTLYLFGSGSTAHRKIMIKIDANSKHVFATHDMTDFYAILQSFGNISDADLNIEGAIYTGEVWYFVQRGNMGTGTNGIFTVTGDITGFDYSIIYNQYKLPKIDGIETSFTDATLIDDTIYFVATAEKTASAYDDGEIVGTIVGQINTDKMKVRKTHVISKTHKFEGISFYSSVEDKNIFVLCEDNDSAVLESNIYKLTLPK